MCRLFEAVRNVVLEYTANPCAAPCRVPGGKSTHHWWGTSRRDRLLIMSHPDPRVPCAAPRATVRERERGSHRSRKREATRREGSKRKERKNEKVK
jgi:hypothetical protein